MSLDVPKIPLKEDAANRWQDLARNAINYLLHRQELPVYTSSNRPQPCDKLAGQFVLMRDDRQAEQLFVCLRGSNGAYSWVVVAISP